MVPLGRPYARYLFGSLYILRIQVPLWVTYPGSLREKRILSPKNTHSLSESLSIVEADQTLHFSPILQSVAFVG